MIYNNNIPVKPGIYYIYKCVCEKDVYFQETKKKTLFANCVCGIAWALVFDNKAEAVEMRTLTINKTRV